MWDLDPVTIGKSATVFYIEYGPLLVYEIYCLMFLNNILYITEWYQCILNKKLQQIVYSSS